MSKQRFGEYLWQCTGDADPVIGELEWLLAPLRYDRPLRDPDHERGESPAPSPGGGSDTSKPKS